MELQKKTTEYENVDTSTALETLDMQLEDLREGKLTSIKRKWSWQKG